MAKHTLTTFDGYKWEWDDDKPEDTDTYRLLKVVDELDSLHKWSTYEVTDPYASFNDKLQECRGYIIDWLKELTATSNKKEDS